MNDNLTIIGHSVSCSRALSWLSAGRLVAGIEPVTVQRQDGLSAIRAAVDGVEQPEGKVSLQGKVRRSLTTAADS